METIHKATPKDISEALRAEIYDWKSASLNALDNCFSRNAKTISTLPPAFRAAAAFSFASNATEKLFPTSLGALLLKRAAIPIWLTSEAVNLYKLGYADQAKDANKLLQQDYLRFKDAFAEKIDQVETGFLNSPFGRQAAQQIGQIVSKRLFEDDRDAVGHIRTFVDDSKVIDDDSGVHRDRMNQGFGKVLHKIKAVYAGSNYGPGRTALYLVRTDQAECGPHTDPRHRLHVQVDDINVNAQKSQYKAELAQLKGRFIGKSQCILPLSIINKGNLGGFPARREAMRILANIDRYDLYHDPATVPVFGSTETYIWNNQQSNSSLEALAGSFAQGLNSQVIQALTLAEEAVWARRS
ncbi:hypothetical protein [Motiliproteus sp. MSK22-1]|uniref:hypothetical protein n=1 Tax=Motiliproteus sp. MSK22-1 TaxID=1897630 RepID=UPI000978C016|nr:hypothetical protein [Motiliproteus sp. MSK22-1]OMH30312.1 hypothetical protein BGP75_18165 [Motiliproteus sp. MSK22-1]